MPHVVDVPNFCVLTHAAYLVLVLKVLYLDALPSLLGHVLPCPLAVAAKGGLGRAQRTRTPKDRSGSGLTRKGATRSAGTVAFSGVPGVNVPEGTVVTAPNGQEYETLEFITLTDQPTEVAVRSLTPGTDANQPAGTVLALASPLSGVSADVVVVDLRGGTEVETDEELRARVLERIRKPPMGGDADDYVAWAMSIPSVTRAWCAPREMGMGTVTVRFMCDALRADNAGFPRPRT